MDGTIALLEHPSIKSEVLLFLVSSSVFPYCCILFYFLMQAANSRFNVSEIHPSAAKFAKLVGERIWKRFLDPINTKSARMAALLDPRTKMTNYSTPSEVRVCSTVNAIFTACCALLVAGVCICVVRFPHAQRSKDLTDLKIWHDAFQKVLCPAVDRVAPASACSAVGGSFASM